MSDSRPRWEREAERLRQRMPRWLDLERLPWWTGLVLAAAYAAWGAYSLAAAESGWDRLGALVLHVAVPGGFLLGARRRKRGQRFFPDRR